MSKQAMNGKGPGIRAAVAMAVVIVAPMLLQGCAGENGNADMDAPAEFAEAQTVLTQQGDQLAIIRVNERTLTGTLRDDSHSVSFELILGTELDTLTIKGVDGTEILSAAVDESGQALHFGGGIVEHANAQRGSVSGYELLHFDESLGETVRSERSLEFLLAQRLGRALGEQADVYPEFLGSLEPLARHGEFQPTEIGQAQQPYSAEGCAACHGACAAYDALCITATWGLGVIFCLITGGACHAACATTVCQ